MKDFRKNEQGLYICEECGLTFSCKENVSKHVKYHNMSVKDYYDKWCKELGDGFCKECGKEISIKQTYCSKQCQHVGAGKKTSEAAIKKRNKIKENYKFICLECNDKFKTSIKLKNHIIKCHDIKNYYDKFIKKENEEFCVICKNPTKFTGRYNCGYELCCSKECREKYRLEQRTKTNLIKYGVSNVYQSPEVKQKIKKTFIEHYGVDNNMKSIKGKNAYSKSIKNKYGVNWPTQNKEILEKGQKTAKLLKEYKNTGIYYQGSYELDFLKKYYEKYLDVKRGPTIKYKKQNKIYSYHPDFYIASLNLIVEIKSSWTLNLDEDIDLKKKATIDSGFKYLMILNKDYNELEQNHFSQFTT